METWPALAYCVMRFYDTGSLHFLGTGQCAVRLTPLLERRCVDCWRLGWRLPASLPLIRCAVGSFLTPPTRLRLSYQDTVHRVCFIFGSCTIMGSRLSFSRAVRRCRQRAIR